MAIDCPGDVRRCHDGRLLRGPGTTTSVPSTSSVPTPGASTTATASPSARTAVTPVPPGRIVFHRRGPGEVEHYFTINTDGTGETPIYEGEGCGPAHLSFDGRQVLSIGPSGHGTWSLMTLNLDGGDKTVVRSADRDPQPLHRRVQRGRPGPRLQRHGRDQSREHRPLDCVAVARGRPAGYAASRGLAHDRALRGDPGWIEDRVLRRDRAYRGLYPWRRHLRHQCRWHRASAA